MPNQTAQEVRQRRAAKLAQPERQEIENWYADAKFELRDQYRIETTDPYLHFLARKIELQREIERERLIYMTAKEMADEIYLSNLSSLADEFRDKCKAIGHFHGGSQKRSVK